MDAYIVCIKLLHDRAIEHSSGRVYFHSVIKNINVYLAADFHIVTVNEGINNNLVVLLVRDIRGISTRPLPVFFQRFLVLFLTNSVPFCKQRYQRTAVFLIIKCFHNARRLYPNRTNGYRTDGSAALEIHPLTTRLHWSAYYFHQQAQKKQNRNPSTSVPVLIR